jgi:large conductance mechanosensitive channel
MVKDTLKGFKEFILRGNAIDLAVGIVIGAGFSGVVNALVKDLITPIIGAFINTGDFSNLAFTINGSKFAYGDFINALISFVLVAAVVYFFVITPMNILIAKMHKQPPADPANKKCPECLSEIPIAAKRCAFCAQIVA